MTERYSVTDSKVYLEFDDKDPEARLDYEIDFTALIDEGFHMDTPPEVEIEAAGNGESPIELLSQDPAIVTPSDDPQDLLAATAISFWLAAGTSGVRYRGKIKCDLSGPGSPAPIKTLVKRFYIVVKLT
jgi:hypothetical protein